MNDQMIYLKVHGMPCNNRCRHCYYRGGDQRADISASNLKKIINAAVSLKKNYQFVFIQFFDEMTLHGSWLETIELMQRHGLIFPGYFIPTNGTGLIHLSDNEWNRLDLIDNLEFQFTFYGSEKVHDAFAGRKGAYRDLVTAIKNLGARGIEWNAGIIAWPGNLDYLRELKTQILELAPGCTAAGWFLPMWQGRGQDDSIRCRQKDLGSSDLFNSHIKTERELIELIESDDSLSSKLVVDAFCPFMSLEINSDMEVFHGGFCDSAFPEAVQSHMKLGTLDETGFESLIDQALNHPPQGIQMLKCITWRDLMEKCGDRNSDMLFMINDLVGNKWLGEYCSRF